LEIADGKDDFGTVWDNNLLEWVLPIRNHDSAPITVESVGLSCSCISLTPSSFIINPGEEVQVRLLINLAAKQRSSEEAAFELFPVVRLGDGEPQKLHWTLRGKVRRFVTPDEPLSFGRTSLASKVQPINVVFSTGEPLPDGFDVQVSHPDYSATVTPEPGQPTRHRLRVTRPETMVPQDISLEVVLRPRGEHSQQYPVTTLVATGQVVRDVEPTPATLLVGGVTLGDVTTHSVSLASMSGSPFTVLDYTLSGDGISVALEGEEYRVSQRAVMTGPQSSKVIFRVRAADGEYTVPLSVSYTVIKP
jgi:hypothetical protein